MKELYLILITSLTVVWVVWRLTPSPPPVVRVLVTCKPIRGEVQPVLGNRATQEGGVTKFFNLEDSSWVSTTSPCLIQEVR